MARKPTDAAAAAPRDGRIRSVADARGDLLSRAALDAAGAASRRSDPLADAKAVRTLVGFVSVHAKELARRGLSPHYAAAALELGREIESHLSALPAAALAARGRSSVADLIADAAETAHAVREAVARVTRGPDGRRAAQAFGLGEPLNARQPAHVLRALQRLVAAASTHAAVAADAGLLPDDLETMSGLAAELEALPGGSAGGTDEASALLVAQGGLRVFFDLVAAKATLALSGDPDERARLLSTVPRADERRHRATSAGAATASG
ncbi:MAG: hypothetical protein NVS4B10_22420 [Myxococcales bacterium]